RPTPSPVRCGRGSDEGALVRGQPPRPDAGATDHGDGGEAVARPLPHRRGEVDDGGADHHPGAGRPGGPPLRADGPGDGAQGRLPLPRRLPRVPRRPPREEDPPAPRGTLWPRAEAAPQASAYAGPGRPPVPRRRRRRLLAGAAAHPLTRGWSSNDAAS